MVEGQARRGMNEGGGLMASRKRKGNSGAPTQGQRDPAARRRPTGYLHVCCIFSCFLLIIFAVCFSVMLCICSLDLLLSVVHEAGSYRMDGSWKRHDCWDLGCEDVLSCFTYGRMGEVDFRFNIYLLRPFENLTVISLSYRAIFC